jgi:hypothetical protein
MFHASGVNYLCTSTACKSEIRTWKKKGYKFKWVQANALKN